MFRIICAEYLKSNSNMRNHIASRNHYNSKDMINRICNYSDDHRSFFLWRSAESFGETRSRERCNSSILDACRDAQVLKCIPRCTSADAHHVQQPNLCTTVHRARHALTLPQGTSADRATEVASVTKRTPRLSDCSPLDGPSETFEAVFTLSNHALQHASSNDLWTLSTMAMPTSLSEEPLTRRGWVTKNFHLDPNRPRE